MSERPSPRVQEHLERLRLAGLDSQAFFEALIEIRDDNGLPTAHREALYKCIAMESFIWYLESLRGEPIDRIKAMQEAAEITIENEAAIKQRRPGDTAVELLKRNIGLKPGERTAPPDAQTVNARPPRPAGPRKKKPKPRAKPRAAGPSAKRPKPATKIPSARTKLDRPKKKDPK